MGEPEKKVNVKISKLKDENENKYHHEQIHFFLSLMKTGNEEILDILLKLSDLYKCQYAYNNDDENVSINKWINRETKISGFHQ